MVDRTAATWAQSPPHSGRNPGANARTGGGRFKGRPTSGVVPSNRVLLTLASVSAWTHVWALQGVRLLQSRPFQPDAAHVAALSLQVRSRRLLHPASPRSAAVCVSRGALGHLDSAVWMRWLGSWRRQGAVLCLRRSSAWLTCGRRVCTRAPALETQPCARRCDGVPLRLSTLSSAVFKPPASWGLNVPVLAPMPATCTAVSVVLEPRTLATRSRHRT